MGINTTVEPAYASASATQKFSPAVCAYVIATFSSKSGKNAITKVAQYSLPTKFEIISSITTENLEFLLKYQYNVIIKKNQLNIIIYKEAKI